MSLLLIFTFARTRVCVCVPEQKEKRCEIFTRGAVETFRLRFNDGLYLDFFCFHFFLNLQHIIHMYTEYISRCFKFDFIGNDIIHEKKFY